MSLIVAAIICLLSGCASAQPAAAAPPLSGKNVHDDRSTRLNSIQLVAVVRGNDAVNPFNVTEVYVKLDGTWKLAALSFTRLMTPPGQ